MRPVESQLSVIQPFLSCSGTTGQERPGAVCRAHYQRLLLQPRGKQVSRTRDTPSTSQPQSRLLVLPRIRSQHRSRSKVYSSPLPADGSLPHDIHLLVSCARELAVIYWDVLHCGLSRGERLPDSHLYDAVCTGYAVDLVRRGSRGCC